MQSTGDGLYFGLSKALKAGDILTIEGAFGCDNQVIQYNIEKSYFKWNGTGWENYKPKTTVQAGAVTSVTGDAASAYFAFAEGVSLPIDSWDFAFDYVSGNGITLNGTMINMDNTVKSVGNKFFANLGSVAQDGDVLKIGGVFRYNAENVEYVIENSEFVWDEEAGAWIDPSASMVTDEVGVLTVDPESQSGSNATAANVYLKRTDGEDFPVLSWDHEYVYVEDSGDGVLINGEPVTPAEIKFANIGHSTMWINLSNLNVKVGDVITVCGAFYSVAANAEYWIEETSFSWNGTGWIDAYSEGVLNSSDVVTLNELGVGAGMALEGTEDKSGLVYTASTVNKTASVQFVFGYNSVNTAAGCLEIRLRGGAWSGIRFRILDGVLQSYYSENSTNIALKSNQDYVIELGAIDLYDGENIWVYAKVDGALLISDTISKEAANPKEELNPLFGTFTQNSVSIYAGNVAFTTLTDPDHVAVVYKTQLGKFVEYASVSGEYTLVSGRTYDAFIGWSANGSLYQAGTTLDNVAETLTLTEVSIDYTLDAGAAIRLATTADESGIRFTTFINEEDLNALLGKYGIQSVSYGTLIMPYDYLAEGQAPNLEQFEAGKTVLQIPSTQHEVVDGVIIYRGAMTKLYTANYGRLFAGRGYMTFTFENGETQTIYTPFHSDDNVRSVRFIAQALQADTTEYTALSTEKKAVVDAYAATEEIALMNYASYAANNFLNNIAWYYPTLDESNNYNNETNVAIAKKLTDAGMKAVYLDGAEHLGLDSVENIEKTRQIIKFFWSQGLKTIAFASNAGGNNAAIDYSTKVYPDFSDCEGFMGFLIWDEPAASNMDQIASMAAQFEILYAGTDVTFMTNLLPSYASVFNGTTNWWQSSIESLKKDEYKAYLQAYITKVLSQIKGEKWLSLDSYPINADKSLTVNFLFDLAMLKTYALSADAHSHIVLQSSGWTEDGNTTKNRMPTEEEMRMQAYAAMAFGIDSISWWSYANKRGDNQSNPTDSEEYYTRFANVNNELAAISAIYSAFTWKGLIFSSGTADSNAYKLLSGELGAYELSASDTKHLQSVSKSSNSCGYLMGVMQDMNGNEGYVLCNYNNHKSDRTQTITLKFASNVTEAVIYRGGVAQTVSVTNKTLAISLATGEGVIVLPSKLG